MLNKKLQTTINYFKTSIKNKRLIVKIKKTLFSKLFLRILLNEKLIFGFFDNKDTNEYIVLLKYDYLTNQCLIKDFKIYLKSSQIKIFKWKDLKNNKKLYKYSNSVKNSIMVLSTNEGLMTREEAIKKHLGGVLILLIFF